MILKTVRYPFYVGIAALIVSIILILTGLFLFISHRESKAAAIHMADRLFSEINTKTMDRYGNTLESVAMVAGLAARIPGMSTMPNEDGTSHPGMQFMLAALDFNSDIFSVYSGYKDGSFIQIVSLRNRSALRRLFEAPLGTAYVLRTISINGEGKLKQRWRFLNNDQQVIGEGPNMDPTYDPRVRPWYLQAQQEETAFYTAPYIFSSTKLPGITCAEKLINGKGVFGIDITLDHFSRSLERQRVSDNGTLFLFDRSGRIIVHPSRDPIKAGKEETLDFISAKEFDDPLVQAVVAAYQQNPDGMLNRAREIRIDGSAYLVRWTGLKDTLKFDQILASIAPLSDFTGHIRYMQQRIFIFSSIVLVLVMLLGLLVSRKITRSLTQLEAESRKIRERDFSESAPSDSAIREIHSLITAFVLMKRTIRQLLEQQRKLFDDFTKLIAGAIDAKSSYTGGHCARVPRLAEMIAHAVCNTDKKPFAGFDMNTEDERWEFEVAAWLHDCGKVTTPEHVVDKATRLNTIYNRIHEIRMRFEVLLRDAEIDTCQKLLTGKFDKMTLKAELESTKQKIKDDFAFVASCNVSEAFLSDEKIERLRQIAARTWTRYLDDRLGISQEEMALKSGASTAALPVTEHVLADKQEHSIPRNKLDSSYDKNYGFKMSVPENKMNLGELYNLSIREGTLSPEDRFQINEHIIQTIIMLNRLEFPDYLAKVPEFAGAHHETMIGSGYPRGLKKEEIPLAARIIAIADIFEALTAADRPYKKAKTLNETLRLMSAMRNDEHIDADLFDLFLESGVYREYAEQYLDPVLIDAVDIRQYLSKDTSSRKAV